MAIEMKAEELRINNWINQTMKGYELVQIPTKVTPTHLMILTGEIDGGEIVMSPIHLSEEVMLKCGFEKTYYGYKYHMGNIVEFVLKNNEIYLGYFDDDDWCRIGKSIKYLHQLQNIIHALTGEELEVSF